MLCARKLSIIIEQSPARARGRSFELLRLSPQNLALTIRYDTWKSPTAGPKEAAGLIFLLPLLRVLSHRNLASWSRIGSRQEQECNFLREKTFCCYSLDSVQAVFGVWSMYPLPRDSCSAVKQPIQFHSIHPHAKCSAPVIKGIPTSPFVLPCVMLWQ